MSDQKFTSSALAALRLAQENAARLGHSYVGSEHLLLGVSSLEQSLAAQLLKQYGVDRSVLRQSISQLVGIGIPSRSIYQGLTPHCRQSIQYAATECRRCGQDCVNTEHLLLGLLLEQNSAAVRILSSHGINTLALYKSLTAALDGGQLPARPVRNREPERSQSETRQLDQCSRDLTAMAADGKLDPVVGRDDELRRVIQILSRRSKNNPALIGEPGVGKTAVVEGLAQIIADGTAPAHLANHRICSLDLAAMVAGTKYRGEFEEKLRHILNEVRKSGNIILFIDELHTIMGTGSAEGAIDAANILKPSLSRGEFQVIGATTIDEYRKYIEKDAALERRFQPVTVKEPDRDTTLSILNGLRSHYETHHCLHISEEAMQAAVDLSRRYLPQRFWPDKAIDLIDEAAAQIRLSGHHLPADLQALEKRAAEAQQQLSDAIRQNNFEKAAMLRDAERSFRQQLEEGRHAWQSKQVGLTLEPVHIRTVLTQWTGVPINDPNEEDKSKLQELEKTLQTSLLGQDKAVYEVAQAIRRGRLGLKDPNRPVGAFLFLGPSGVGKTQLCRTLAKSLFGTEESLIRFDMSEYMEAHAVSRLIGSPPGYVGHEEGGQLTEKIRRNPWSVVLLDELEKAHRDIWSLLLQVMEEGVLTDGQGRRTDFRNTVLIMTSNLGSRRFSQTKKLGFSTGAEADRSQVEADVLGDAKNTFPPEFLNRLDQTLVFHPLDDRTLSAIVRQFLDQTGERLKALGVSLQVEESAVHILAQEGRDQNYGARPLRRAIAAQVENPAADLLLQQDVPEGATLLLAASGGKVEVKLV